MKQDSNLVKNHSHDSMAQVAWLYHVGNLSQQEISDKLGISRFKIVGYQFGPVYRGTTLVMVVCGALNSIYM